MNDIKIISLIDYPNQLSNINIIYYKKNDKIIKYFREDLNVMWQNKFLGFIIFKTCPFTEMWIEDYGKLWTFEEEKLTI